MKKLLFLIILGSIALCSNSCIKTCTCINGENPPTSEFEVDPSENCKDYSSVKLGDCS